MNANNYLALAMRTNDGHSAERLIDKMRSDHNIGETLDACLGLSGEVGELNDMVKKWIFHEADMDDEHLKKELGDVCWYVALFCHSMHWSLDEVLQLNIDKLRKRYPNGFQPKVERRENDV